MKNKVITIIEIIAIVIAAILIIVFKAIPEYKKTQGSSDTFINSNSYEDIIEIKINNSPNFALVTTKEKVTNILFFDNKSLCLYNKDIENKSIDKASKEIIELLMDNSYFQENNSIILTNYNDKDYNKVKNSIISKLEDLGISINLVEKKSTIKMKANQLQIEIDSDSDESNILRLIELYSKEIVNKSTNNASSKNNADQNNILNETLVKIYADNVYKKIEKYASTNNISNQDINNSNLPINLIPANEEGTYYPNEESWYYIKSNKVYAYIKFVENNTSYEYCYNGSIDEYIKGKC